MMRMTNNNSSCEVNSEEKMMMKKKIGVINIIPPSSSVAVTTTTAINEWSQDNHESDFLPTPGGVGGGRGGGGGGVMLKQMKAQHPPGSVPAPVPQQDQGPWSCPRCNSSNTKFCYYNNYSLSQPRHFCKSCKRYWTRGGTLRNVPVGGGCRKNKRVKRPSPAGVTPAVTLGTASRAGDGNAPAAFPYGNPHELELSYAALGFSSGIGESAMGGFTGELVVNPSSNSVVPGYGAATDFLGMSSVGEIPCTSSPLLASMIFQEQQKFMINGGLGLKPSCPLENDVQVKFAEGLVDWSAPQQGQFDEVGLSDLPASCWNTFANSISSWHRNESGNNAGSSIPSLI
ncbi:hypothetical protein MLD38_021158 [Melastoma candidum]|uniref:Uncharacterized protein n=1 Tax=Melastoma candidum TaxID=119954 RepID=A0ACB9QEM2_9MYRT|nr:hypothetical protein MLD38_021158 [Melastoma candidum]